MRDAVPPQNLKEPTHTTRVCTRLSEGARLNLLTHPKVVSQRRSPIIAKNLRLVAIPMREASLKRSPTSWRWTSTSLGKNRLSSTPKQCGRFVGRRISCQACTTAGRNLLPTQRHGNRWRSSKAYQTHLKEELKSRDTSTSCNYSRLLRLELWRFFGLDYPSYKSSRRVVVAKESNECATTHACLKISVHH